MEDTCYQLFFLLANAHLGITNLALFICRFVHPLGIANLSLFICRFVHPLLVNLSPSSCIPLVNIVAIRNGFPWNFHHFCLLDNNINVVFFSSTANSVNQFLQSHLSVRHHCSYDLQSFRSLSHFSNIHTYVRRLLDFYQLDHVSITLRIEKNMDAS